MPAGADDDGGVPNVLSKSATSTTRSRDFFDLRDLLVGKRRDERTRGLSQLSNPDE